MKHTFMVALIAGCAILTACGEDAAKPARQVKVMPEKLQAARQRWEGGRVRKPMSGSGRIAFINAQERVPFTAFKQGVESMLEFLHVDADIRTGAAVTPQTAGAAVTASGCQVAAFLVDTEGLPALLVAPEERWAIINTKKLATVDVSAEKLAERVRKETVRAFFLLCGAGDTQMMESVLSPLVSIGDLDAAPEGVPLESISIVETHLARFGVKPFVINTYRKACEEGWAPTPTNDVQKRVWDKVHKLPSKPLKIKFDPKKR